MEYINQKPKWPNFTWNHDALARRLAEVRFHQGLLLGRMKSLGFDLRSQAALNTAVSEVIKSSAIEGEFLDPNKVRSSVARHLGLETGGKVVAGRDVEGIVEVMTDATRRFREPLTATRLFAWHAALFPTGRSGITTITAGAWRTDERGPMRVLSGPMGRGKEHFQVPHAERVDTEMSRFLDWFNNEEGTDPVLKAGTAHFWFVTIHPFDDGNGRIARAIADMLLARADGIADRFYSMSSQIESERTEYYRQLEAQQRGDIDLTPWLQWFIECLDRSFDRAGASLEHVVYKGWVRHAIGTMSANERQRTVVERMMDRFQGYLNTSKYARMAKCSTDTALRDIRDLVEHGILVRNPGGGRSTSYRLASTGEVERIGDVEMVIDPA
ncbi:MAG: Fic family protein [Spirochaetaceae bacterium]|nr:MAG: Fic family protein [Spirochaetaceae bacterium]